MRLAFGALSLALALPLSVRAQAPETVSETAVTAAPALVLPSTLDAAAADRLASLRLSQREARHTEGYVLLGWALASVVGGGVIAGAGYQDERWLGAGLGTLGWGAINALFSIFLFDLSGGQLRDIEADRALRGRELDVAREDWAAGQYSTAAIIAVNAGLDVFYVATGILLWVIAAQSAPELRWLEGYGAAMAVQGGALLGYDVTTWIAASQRGDEARALFRDDDEASEP
jgi:hypothetical protein